jgi:2-hydroxy-6-oxonona-2,4-dienedioate hydrolase
MVSRRMLLGLGLAAVALGAGGTAVWTKYSEALRAHRLRLGQGSQIVASRFGDIEFATEGNGTPLLVVHGAGGGFDQALSGASRLIAAGYRIVAPSRFGYLRSANPPDPSPENQADAYAALLDELRLDRVAVAGISAGALSALQFAARYPERCRSLTLLVPAASVSGVAAHVQGPTPVQSAISKAVIEYTLKSDFIFWLGIVLARDQMIRAVLASDPALVAAASPDERRRAHDILWNILPLSERSQGLLNDARFVSTPMLLRFDRIKAPTFIVSLEDDFYRTIEPARVLAEKIPGARLLSYASGGHVWIGHDAEIFVAIDAFLRRN